MKKRWGKPITQVQRFVPQYCQTPCDDTYMMKALSTFEITNKDDIRVDWGNDGFVNGRDQTWYATSDYPSPIRGSLLDPLVDPMYKHVSGTEITYGNKISKYDNSREAQYESYSSSIQLYKFNGYKAYKAVKTTS